MQSLHLWMKSFICSFSILPSFLFLALLKEWNLQHKLNRGGVSAHHVLFLCFRDPPPHEPCWEAELPSHLEAECQILPQLLLQWGHQLSHWIPGEQKARSDRHLQRSQGPSIAMWAGLTQWALSTRQCSLQPCPPSSRTDPSQDGRWRGHCSRILSRATDSWDILCVSYNALILASASGFLPTKCSPKRELRLDILTKYSTCVRALQSHAMLIRKDLAPGLPGRSPGPLRQQCHQNTPMGLGTPARCFLLLLLLQLNSFFFEHLLHVRNCSGSFGGSSEQNRQKLLFSVSSHSRMHIGHFLI